jgi:transposase
VGRRYHDHRRVLGGILWVARSGSSWREMPEEYGKWQTAYRRYELWVKQGLWPRHPRSIAILAPGRRTVSSALRAMGLDQDKRFHRYHRVLTWLGIALMQQNGKPFRCIPPTTSSSNGTLAVPPLAISSDLLDEVD